MAMTGSIDKALSLRSRKDSVSIQVLNIWTNWNKFLTFVAQEAIRLESFSAEELAHEISLIEYELFRAIQPKELMKQSWQKEGKEHKAPNILAYLEWLNRIAWYLPTK